MKNKNRHIKVLPSHQNDDYPLGFWGLFFFLVLPHLGSQSLQHISCITRTSNRMSQVVTRLHLRECYLFTGANIMADHTNAKTQ